MALIHRLQRLELKVKTKIPGCNLTLFIAVPKDSQNAPFDSNSYRPAADETEEYLKHLKDHGLLSPRYSGCTVQMLRHQD